FSLPPTSVLAYLIRPPPQSPLFPYTTLFRSVGARHKGSRCPTHLVAPAPVLGECAQVSLELLGVFCEQTRAAGFRGYLGQIHGRDRKSTRLNSSHQIISYAVFCLKKKNK